MHSTEPFVLSKTAKAVVHHEKNSSVNTAEGADMGKGDRRNRKQSIGVELATVPRRKAQGKKRMKEIKREKQQRNPHRTALEVRARQMGHDPDKWQLMQFQALGEPAGQALFAAHTVEDAVGLWSVYAGLTNAEARYHRTCLGKSMAAKVAKVEFLPESFEVDPDEQPDLRDEDEKHRDAKNNWDTWLGHFNKLTLSDRAIIQSVSRGWCDPMIDGTLTMQGKQFVKAVECLSVIVDMDR